jgi:hypothetical protein
LNKCVNPYAGQGIEVTGKKMCAGERINLVYSGLLAASGADRVFVHYGYGDAWDSPELREMTGCGGRFETVIELKTPGRLNVCFKDSAGNWDNNTNRNYTFSIRAKRSAERAGKSKQFPAVEQ